MTEILSFENKIDRRHFCKAYFLTGKKKYCTGCQGGDKLEQHKGRKKDWFLAIELICIDYEGKVIKRDVTNLYCQDCYKKKLKDMKFNPELINYEVLQKLEEKADKELKKYNIEKVKYQNGRLFSEIKKVDEHLSKLKITIKVDKI